MTADVVFWPFLLLLCLNVRNAAECWMGSCWETQPFKHAKATPGLHSQSPQGSTYVAVHTQILIKTSQTRLLSAWRDFIFFVAWPEIAAQTSAETIRRWSSEGNPAPSACRGYKREAPSPHPLPNGRPVTVCFSFTRDEMRRRLRATRISVPVSHKWLKRLPAEKKEK